MLSFGFRIFCWYRGFCHRTGSDLLLFLVIYACCGMLTCLRNDIKKRSEFHLFGLENSQTPSVPFLLKHSLEIEFGPGQFS